MIGVWFGVLKNRLTNAPRIIIIECYVLAGSISGEERWKKVLTVLYGEEGLKRLQPRLQQLGDLDAVPVTVDALRAFNADAARAGLVPRLPLWSRPARRAILKTALDEGVRKRIIAEGIDLDAVRTDVGDRLAAVEDTCTENRDVLLTGLAATVEAGAAATGGRDALP